MRLPRAPAEYDQGNEQSARNLLATELSTAFFSGRDMNIGVGRFIMTSPNGNRWSITVSNAGALVVTAI